MYFICCRAAHNPNSRKALTGDGVIFKEAHDGVAEARQLHFKPEDGQEAAELYNDPEVTVSHTRPAQEKEAQRSEKIKEKTEGNL